MGLHEGDRTHEPRPEARQGPPRGPESDCLSEATKLALRLAPAIADLRVLAAIASIPRERFVEPSLRDRAYANVALPIACDQTISQPLVVARMLELLELAPTDRVLDVGTGSGYHAAALALLAGEVYTIERHPDLTRAAERTIRELGLDNVHFAVGDRQRCTCVIPSPFPASLRTDEIMGQSELTQSLGKRPPIHPRQRKLTPHQRTRNDRLLVEAGRNLKAHFPSVVIRINPRPIQNRRPGRSLGFVQGGLAPNIPGNWTRHWSKVNHSHLTAPLVPGALSGSPLSLKRGVTVPQRFFTSPINKIPAQGG